MSAAGPDTKRQDRPYRAASEQGSEGAPRQQASHPRSPSWGPNTKLIVGLVMVIGGAALLARFQFLLGPLLAAFMLAYLLHPLARFLSARTRLGWTATVNILFLCVILLVIALSVYVGITALDQGTWLLAMVQRSAEQLPQLIDSLPSHVRVVSFDVNLAALHIDDALRALSGSLGNAVSLTVDVITGLLSGLISLFGLGLFVVIIAYFVLQGTGPDVSMELSINPDDPGYRYDLQRGQRELSRVWRAYLGGQITLSVLTFVAYLATLTALGVNETLALSILAALARFVPYVGAAITWSVTAVLVFFQGGQFLGLDPWAHTLVVLVAVIVVDQAIDHLIMPRVMGRVLGVHPAAVMIAVIAGAQLLGIVGLVLAAPVLASLWLGVRYALRKLFDADPWPDPEPNNDGENFLATRIRSRWNKPRA